MDKGIVKAGQCIDVLHHAGGSMDHSEVITEEFLGPTADDVNETRVIKYFLDSAAIADPVEDIAPEELAVLANCPTATGSLADKRMIVTFAFGATTGSETDGAEPGTMHGEVEQAFAGSKEVGSCCNRSIGVIRLHEDPTHTKGGPVVFQKTGFGGLVAGKAGGVIANFSLSHKERREGVQRGVGMGLR